MFRAVAPLPVTNDEEIQQTARSTRSAPRRIPTSSQEARAKMICGQGSTTSDFAQGYESMNFEFEPIRISGTSSRSMKELEMDMIAVGLDLPCIRLATREIVASTCRLQSNNGVVRCIGRV